MLHNQKRKSGKNVLNRNLQDLQLVGDNNNLQDQEPVKDNKTL